jgi:hypothetical protein
MSIARAASIWFLENVVMKKAMLLIAVLTLVLGLTAFAQTDKPATDQQVQPPAKQGTPAQPPSAEERAKLREKWQNMTPEERAQYRAKTREQFSSVRPGAEALQQRRLLASQITALRQKQQQDVGELQAVKQVATKEKAAETIKALDKLIAKRQGEYQARIKELEQRMEKLQAAQKSEPNQPKPATPPARPPAKSSATKSK